MQDSVSKSWFCVFNNPAQHGYDGTPEQIVEKMIETWIADNPQRTCAVAFCVSADGLNHCHAVFEDVKAMRFSAVKKLFPGMHIEPTKGNKDQAEDYINKRGKFEEKGEVIIYLRQQGEIKGCQGQRKEFEIIEDLLRQGKTPNEIMDIALVYRRHEKMIRSAYFRKRSLETPFFRDIKVYWHVGASGTGKSHVSRQMVEEHGEDYVYMYSDFKIGGLDNYGGEPVLFMDELRGDIQYGVLLKILQGYKMPLHARYSNIIPLWNEVHITSPFPPERLYQKMVQEDTSIDRLDQLLRRITFMVYHYKNGDEYCTLEVPIEEYTNYDALVSRVLGSVVTSKPLAKPGQTTFYEIQDDDELPQGW